MRPENWENKWLFRTLRGEKIFLNHEVTKDTKIQRNGFIYLEDWSSIILTPPQPSPMPGRELKTVFIILTRSRGRCRFSAGGGKKNSSFYIMTIPT